MVALLPCLTNASDIYMEALLSNATSTELSANLIEYGVGYRINSDWSVELKSGSGFRESSLLGINSQHALGVRYNTNVSSDIDVYFLSGIQSVTIETSSSVADAVQQETTESGLMLATGVGFKMNKNISLTAGYHYNDGGGWSSSISGYSIGLTYDL
jgi:opacity protein-like surface antigen